MSVQGFAPRVTRCPTGVTTTIANGENVRIYGIIISSAQTVGFLNNAGTTLFTIVVNVAGMSNNICWLADAGLKVAAGAGGDIVIFHSNPGA